MVTEFTPKYILPLLTRNFRRPAAKILMDFSRGCKSVSSLMDPEVTNTNAKDSGSDGYHSDQGPEADEKK